MASTYTPLGVEKMATGENAGTWGTKTNTNLEILEQISGGYVVQTLNAAGSGANTTTLSVSDGSTGATLATRVIILGAESAQAITGNKIVTIPLDVENWYFIKNSTSGAYTVEFKYVSGSGGTVTWGTTDKGWKAIYASANDGTNPDVVDIGMGDVTLAGTQTLTNKTLTSPKIGTSILDTNGNELFILTATGSAVNEITYANAGTGTGPTFTASGETNVDININPKGSGVLKSGTAAVKIAGKETIWVPAGAMYAATTNGASAEQIETTATRPDIKVLDFDPSTAEYAQFAVAMPKSWNLGTVTYQAFWTPSTTNTGNCIFGLQGVSCSDGDTADVVFGTAQEVTDAGIGTVEDIQVTSESSAMTIAGSPADDDMTFFQVYRDAADGSDTFTGDARLIGIKLFFTTDAANDA
tara:strand:- start:6462 stop:7700 length:1239 start_codon:yes stop_codon:yes gene_type:complete